jgi:amino acid transporter
MGLIVILGLLYGCQEKISSILEDSSDATVNFFKLVCSGNSLGVYTMVIVVFLNAFLSGFSAMTVSSRIGYAITRDGVLPFSK